MRPLKQFRVWLAWVALVHGAFAYFAWFRPDLLSNGAYIYATNLVSFRVWSVVSALVCLTLIYSFLRHSIPAAFVGLGLALPTQAVFGASIFILTFDGSVAAIIGSFQWWTMGVANALMLWSASTAGLRMEPK